MRSPVCPSCGHRKRSAAINTDGLCDGCRGTTKTLKQRLADIAGFIREKTSHPFSSADVMIADECQTSARGWLTLMVAGRILYAECGFTGFIRESVPDWSVRCDGEEWRSASRVEALILSGLWIKHYPKR